MHICSSNSSNLSTNLFNKVNILMYFKTIFKCESLHNEVAEINDIKSVLNCIDLKLVHTFLEGHKILRNLHLILSFVVAVKSKAKIS